MIPGQVVDFDLIVITWSDLYGRIIAVSLLFAFRLTYYIIPFLLEVLSSFSNTWEAYQQK